MTSCSGSDDGFEDLRTLAAVVKPAAGLEAVRFIGVVGVVAWSCSSVAVCSSVACVILVTRTSVAPSST